MTVGKSVNIRAILGIRENFQSNSAPPNIKYNFVVLFLSQLYILFIYASKYFLIHHHYKRYVRIYDLLAKGKIYWCSRSVNKHRPGARKIIDFYMEAKFRSVHFDLFDFLDYNKCSEQPRFCLNGATCEPTWTSAVCHCADRYQGDRCENCTARFQGDGCDECVDGNNGIIVVMILVNYQWSFMVIFEFCKNFFKQHARISNLRLFWNILTKCINFYDSRNFFHLLHWQILRSTVWSLDPFFTGLRRLRLLWQLQEMVRCQERLWWICCWFRTMLLCG